MVHLLFWGMLCCTLCTYTNEQKPLVVNVNNNIVNNTQNAQQTQTALDVNQSNQQLTIQETYIQQWHTVTNMLHNAYDHAKDNAHSLYAYIKTNISQNKWSIGIGSVIAAYAASWVLSLRDAAYIRDTALWSHWKPNYALEQLYALNQQELQHDLILAIQQRYLNIDQPTDSITPLVQFIQAIQQEKKRLNAYCRRSGWLMRLPLKKLLPVTQATIEQIRELQKKLLFVHTLFLSWASAQNLYSMTHKPL